MPGRKRFRAAVEHRWLSVLLPVLVILPSAAHAAGIFDTAGSKAQAATLAVVVVGLLAASIATAALYLRERARAARSALAARHENSGLKLSLERIHAILEGEPGLRIVYDPQEAAPRLLGDTSLARALGRAESELPDFATWLEAASARELGGRLEALRARGEPFMLVLRSKSGQAVEARGRLAAGRPVLSLVDLEGERVERLQLAEEAARALREIQALRDLLEAMPIPVWRRDKSGRLVWVNPAFAKTVGAASPEEAVAAGMEILDQSARMQLTLARAEGKAARSSVAAVLGGSRKLFDVIETPSDTGAAGMALDVSALDEARAELKRHIAAQARTLDQLTTAVAIFGPDRRLKFFNAAYSDLFALDPAWLASAPEEGVLLDRLRAEDRLPEQADYKSWKRAQLDASRGSGPTESWWHLPDGQTLRVVAAPDPQGGVVYIYENHTERLGLETRYNALVRMEGETLDNLREGVAVFASDGRLRLANPAFGQIWHLSSPLLADRPHIDQVAAWCRNLSAEDGWSEIKRVVTALENRVPTNGRTERLDGGVVDYVAQPLPDGSTLVTFADVTASVTMQRALEERNEALEAADRLKNTFVSHVSYELRSPLTNVIGFVELLADSKTGRLTKKQREYVDHVQTSSAALLAIINDILDLATVDAGGMALDLGEVDIRAAMEAAAEGVHDRIAEGKLTLDIVADPGIGHFAADAKRLRQILFNLLSNAVRFSEPGGRITLEAIRERSAVRFTVRDQGRGIPPEDLAAVFDRFETRGQGATRRGVGLGLSIVKSFVELHEGTVEIASEVGRGTTVTCIFPAEPEVPALRATG